MHDAIEKREKKLINAEIKLAKINKKLKKYKKCLREEANCKKKDEEKKKKKKAVKSKASASKKKNKAVAPEKSLTISGKKELRKVKKTKKDLVKTPTKELRIQKKSKKALTKAKPQKDDLKLIDGIGPKIEEVLYQSGIENYRQLANCSNEALQSILEKHFNIWKAFNFTTWPEQAKLAADGKFEELLDLISKLKEEN